MTSSLTVAFSGTSSVLQAHFFPEIILDADSSYSCALLDFIFYEPNVEVNETVIKKITELDIVRINCDLVSGSYINGVHCHTLHQFATSNSRVNGKFFVEIPKHINYLPIKTHNLRSIQISVFGREGLIADLSGGKIICRINIKRDIVEKSTQKC